MKNDQSCSCAPTLLTAEGEDDLAIKHKDPQRIKEKQIKVARTRAVCKNTPWIVE
jgi:hypothetical protein